MVVVVGKEANPSVSRFKQGWWFEWSVVVLSERENEGWGLALPTFRPAVYNIAYPSLVLLREGRCSEYFLRVIYALHRAPKTPSEMVLPDIIFIVTRTSI